ncbi:MAG TPA: phosphatidylinositol-specific phospholipase C/glycerophosphodiester phosphodiesterase family protein [Cyclobacteriaceae bacterium]|nr:phosphatidylinositol-specific phospholipase C/glycerophosphodiester phosphodiesterase family protein [Cyclobacteriaceae bacterium]
MIRLASIFILTLPAFCGLSQSIFAHNDYIKAEPFYKAFDLKAAYIEADIFLRDEKLLVAHTRLEIDPSKTIQTMYLDPISEKVKAGNDSLYGLTLMIDLKTEGAPTLAALVNVLEQYPMLTSCPGLSITVSGSYPPPGEWKNYPDYIRFDGRPRMEYTREQLDRITLISTSFNSVSSWNGKGEIPARDLQKIKTVIDEAHKLGKPVRFWASPDAPNAWTKFIGIGVDVLNSDDVQALAIFLKERH